MGLGSSVLPPLIFCSRPSAALFNACQLNSIFLPEILSSQHPKKAVIPVESICDTRAFRRSLEELIQTPPLPLSVLSWFTPSPLPPTIPYRTQCPSVPGQHQMLQASLWCMFFRQRGMLCPTHRPKMLSCPQGSAQ